MTLTKIQMSSTRNKINYLSLFVAFYVLKIKNRVIYVNIFKILRNVTDFFCNFVLDSRSR